MDLVKVFQDLDHWIVEQNEESFRESSFSIQSCYFKLLGQTALVQSNLKLDLRLTADIDAYTNAHSSVIAQLDQLLIPYGMKFDHLSSEIWMPEEVEYENMFNGRYLKVQYAMPEYLLISKAKFAREKDIDLIDQYLLSGPSQLFLELASKYKINLEF